MQEEIQISWIFASLLYFIGASILMDGIRRLSIAHAQDRAGPSLFQGFYDLIKLFGKEDLVPEVSSPALFTIAPVICFAAAITCSLLIPVGRHQALGIVGDLVLVIYLLTLIPVGIIIGGSASGSPYAAIGVSREIAQTVAYKLPFITAMVCVALRAGSFDLLQITRSSSFLTTPFAAIALLLTIPAASGVQPFDVPEAEQEIAGGPFVEYSGRRLALMKLSVWMKSFMYVSLIVSVFFGFLIPDVAGLDYLVHFLIVTLLIIAFVALSKASTGRTRVTNLLRMLWILPTALASVDLIGVILRGGWIG